MTWHGGRRRRQFLKGTVATGTLIGVAGCSSDDSTDSSGNDGATGGDSDGVISVGETVSGTLREDSPMSPYEDYAGVPFTLEVEQRQRVRISHESDEFDTQLLLTDENDNILQRNEGSAGSDDPPGDDSLLMPVLSPDETYTVWALRAWGVEDETFEFTLSVGGPSALVGDPIDVTFGETVTADPDAGVPNPFTETTRKYPWKKVPFRLELDEKQRIQFDASSVVPTDDRILPVTEAEANPIGRYTVRLEDTNLVRNEFTSRVRHKDKGRIRINDGGLITLSAGEYFLWTPPGEDVTISKPTPVEERVQGAGHLSPGDTVTGELQPDSSREPYDYLNAVPYTIDAENGQLFSIEVSNPEFTDPGIVLSDMDGNVINVEIRRRLEGKLRMFAEIPEDGRYVIWVRAQPLPGSTNFGKFTLSVPEITFPEETQTVSIGETVTGEITEESPKEPVTNDFAVPYRLERDRTARARIKLESNEFDPKITLTDGTGEERIRSGGTDITLPGVPEGFVLIWAGSETYSETGGFTLSIEVGE